MNIGLIVLAVLCVATLVTMIFAKRRDDGDLQSQAWERAIADESSQVGRILLNVAKPVARINAVHAQFESPQWRGLQKRLLASGSFGGEVEIFLSMQVLCTLLAMMGLGLVYVSGLSTFMTIVGVVGSLGIALYPYNIMAKKYTERQDAVANSLPEFADLLQMPLASGLSVRQALIFTANRIDGPVSDEVRNMETIIRNNPLEEANAFIIAGERLGSPEAVAFFAALLQGHIRGSAVIDTVLSQAEGLRTAAFQRQRGMIKKLPVKLVILFAIHLIPLLFVVAMLPTLLSLGEI